MNFLQSLFGSISKAVSSNLSGKELKNVLRKNVKTYTMIIAMLIIWAFFGIVSRNNVFLTPQNMSNLFRQMIIIALLAVGMVPVIVTGNIDLSVGSVTGFISALVAYIQVKVLSGFLPGMFPNMSDGGIVALSTFLAILTAMVAGLIIGIWHGTLIAYLKIPAFIVTLGSMMIFKGGILIVTKGQTISLLPTTGEPLRIIAQEYIPANIGIIIGVVVVLLIFFFTFYNRRQKITYGFKLHSPVLDGLKSLVLSILVIVYIYIMNQYRGLPNPVFILALITLLFSYLTQNTRFGRYTYAQGGNEEATRLSGVDIKKNLFKVFVLMGLLCGVAGIVLTGYVGAGTTGGGKDYELLAIASCVIGGTSLMGGEGSIFGAVIGALIMVSLENGMSILNMAPEWQFIVKGVVFILAVYIDVASKKKE